MGINFHSAWHVSVIKMCHEIITVVKTGVLFTTADMLTLTLNKHDSLTVRLCFNEKGSDCHSILIECNYQAIEGQKLLRTDEAVAFFSFFSLGLSVTEEHIEH